MRIKHTEGNCHITQYHVVETKNIKARYLELLIRKQIYLQHLLGSHVFSSFVTSWACMI